MMLAAATPGYLTMAEKALKKVEDRLNCSICLDVYTDPKVLQCLHVFCQTCLVRLVFQNDQGQFVLSCPNCRHITPVPANGVAGLQPAFHINDFLDIAKDFRREKEASASSESSSRSPQLEQEVSAFCSEHVKEELKLYCETCGELICLYCALKTGKHHNHDYAPIEEAFETYKKELGALLEPISKQLTSVDEVLTQFDKNKGEISDQRAVIEADIHHTIDRLHQVLDVRRTELIGRLHQLTQIKLKDLVAQKDQAETIHAQLSSCQDFMKQSLETDHWGEALRMKTTVLKQVKELTTTVQPYALKCNVKADITFSAPADITTFCHRFGNVSTLASPDPSKCHVTGRGLESGTVRQTSTAILQVCNSKSEPCTEPVKSLECKLVSEITGARVTGSFKNLGNNRYKISYQPTVKGRHQLHISIQGQHIRGSPFDVVVTSPVMNLGAPIHTIAEVDEPYGIAINHQGEIVVSERGSGHISTYTPSGKKIRTISLRGLILLDIALGTDGDIFITEETKKSIRRYSPKGRLLKSTGVRQLQIDSPDYIAVNTWNKKVYITDNNCYQIHVLNSDFTFSATFPGETGSDEGQFEFPCGITCDRAGNVYVADTANHRVQVFTAEGTFLRMFGSHGEGKGELDWPLHIALDPSNEHVYVSEGNNYRISVFSHDGHFVTSFGVGFRPYGLAVDNSGVVYVCSDNSIHIF